jgi:8-amino-3,8-dideoxy-alpha-D-manno-octulosonate transaminase
MDPIMEIARRYNIRVIEDVAQSCGVTYKGSYQGTIGDMGTFSFQMNKIITAGEGGAVMTRNAAWFERAVRYHDQGAFREKQWYGIDSIDEESEFAGQNYRMSDIIGGIMLEQWNKLQGLIVNMRRTHHDIRQMLTNQLPELQLRRSPDEAGDLGSNLGIILPDSVVANRFIEALHAENIQGHVLYRGQPIYKLPRIFEQRTVEKDNFPFNYPFRNPVRYRDGMCPNAESLIPRTVFVPISPILKPIDGEEIAEGIYKVFRAICSGNA